MNFPLSGFLNLISTSKFFINRNSCVVANERKSSTIYKALHSLLRVLASFTQKILDTFFTVGFFSIPCISSFRKCFNYFNFSFVFNIFVKENDRKEKCDFCKQIQWSLPQPSSSATLSNFLKGTNFSSLKINKGNIERRVAPPGLNIYFMNETINSNNVLYNPLKDSLDFAAKGSKFYNYSHALSQSVNTVIASMRLRLLRKNSRKEKSSQPSSDFYPSYTYTTMHYGSLIVPQKQQINSFSISRCFLNAFNDYLFISTECVCELIIKPSHSMNNLIMS